MKKSNQIFKPELYQDLVKEIVKLHSNTNHYYESDKFSTPIPYDFHLSAVVESGVRFFNLLDEVDYTKFGLTSAESTERVVFFALWGHDLLEDVRLTYNNLHDLFSKYLDHVEAKAISEIIYLVTDFKGRTREERKPDEYYIELSKNELAIFVKLSDMCANMTYGKLFRSSMLPKYKKIDLPKIKGRCCQNRFEVFITYLENI